MIQENHMHGNTNLLSSEMILVAHLVPLMALIIEISTKLVSNGDKCKLDGYKFLQSDYDDKHVIVVSHYVATSY